MYSLIVLGQIPGTNISLSFEAWIILTILTAIVGYRMRKTIGQIFRELEKPSQTNQGLHASQLHQRAL